MTHSAPLPTETTTPAAGRDGYLAALDGLRGVAILCVLLAHLGVPGAPGGFGVTLFFAISGFLITRQLAGELARDGGLRLGAFYGRRALRLLPALVAYVGIAGGAFVAAGGRIGAGAWTAALLYGANYADLAGGFVSSLAGVRHPFNILWSLAIEEHFYAIWPPLLWLLWLLWRRGLAARGLAVACAAALVWRAALFGGCQDARWLACLGGFPPGPWQYNRLYLATDTRFDSLAWGALLALAPLRPARLTAPLAVLAMAASFLLPGAAARHVLRPTLQGAALYALLPALLRGRVGTALGSAPAVAVGRLSYSLYLWHWGALALADGIWPADRPRWVATACVLTLLFALGSWWGIERPMLRLRHLAGSRAPRGLLPEMPHDRRGPAPVPPALPAERRLSRAGGLGLG